MASFNYFKRWITPNKAGQESEALGFDQYQELFQFLVRQITVPKNAEQLIQLGSKVHRKKPDEIFHTYLLFEKYICTFEPEQKYTRQTLRESIADHFPALKSSDPFSILFLGDTEKKNTLAIQFLSSFLIALSEQFGGTAEGFFQQKQNQLNTIEHLCQNEETFKDLQFISIEIFNYVNDNYGEALAGKLFNREYQLLSTKFKELEVFPHLITLIPKEVVRREHLGIFSQSQIEQIFLEKLAETERLNKALDQKIREQETTQKLLADNQAMLGSVISSALDAIVMTDADGIVREWNAAATEIFGYEPGEIKGRSVTSTLIPENHPGNSGFRTEQFFKDPHHPLLNTRFEITCKRKDGTAFPAEFTITAIHNKNGYFFNAFVRDISLPKQREEELVQTKEKAEQAARAKSQFLSIMSHEIRTPLNAIIGFTELLQQNSPRADQLDDLKMLKFSGENLLHIINDILDFNKLESGKVQISCISFNLKELAQTLYQSFSYKAKEKKILFDVEYDENIPSYVKGDSLRLSQILINLVSNAIKFTSDGSVTLKLHLIEFASNGPCVQFSIIDTGIGIPDENQQKIFEQFTQADNDTSRLYGGTGLGLSISSKLAVLMNSSISVQSQPGKGSVFYFRLKFLTSDEEHSTILMPAKVQNVQNPLAGKRILMAEDNAFNANIARRYITGWGAEMDLALDGHQALEFATRNQYDLILMDVQMPEMDGFECSRAIRKTNEIIPIIAMTAAPISDVKDEIARCGMNDHMSKPFKPNDLLAKLKHYLLETPEVPVLVTTSR
jgi:PAS domain S-box-containing protein